LQKDERKILDKTQKIEGIPLMFNHHKQTINWGGRELTLETGKIARQANGAVVVTYGETQVLCAVVADKTVREGTDFFPLTVHYQERAYAAGRFPGGFFKREGKPSEKEVLTSRLIDRPIRPLFPGNFFNETQVICTLLSHDMENDPEVVAMISASAALAISGVPFLGPIGAAMVGYVNGEFILNPTKSQFETSDLALSVAGTETGVLMVESEASELSEEIMLDAVTFAHDHYQPVVEMIKEFAEKVGKERWEVAEESAEEKALFDNVRGFSEQDIRKAYSETVKQVRNEALGQLKDAAIEKFVSDDTAEDAVLKQFKKVEKLVVRGDLLETRQRIDGRTPDQIRPIIAEVDVLPRAHGSALFTRGETQALVVATLGTSQDEQIVDALDGESRQRFLLHYNFPSYSVGEVRRLAPPGRREIGHGKLAWRAVNPLIPTKDDFPYAYRVVSEITESNGSSSMATVCGTSLALMDAGVPLRSPIAGIAMGLVKEEEDFVVLSDILGDEDHLGDMDFKVAGTKNGVTALQMDIKVTGITKEIMSQALKQAHDGRLHILGEMEKAIGESREEVSENAPRMKSISIPKEKIRDVIGSGGKVIREICEMTGAKIEISEEGVVEIAAPNTDGINDAVARIEGIVREPEQGEIFQGKVSKILDFGAVVNFLSDKSGLVHISQIANERIGSVDDVLKVGDSVFVEVVSLDDRGKIRLSMKTVDQEKGTKAES